MQVSDFVFVNVLLPAYSLGLLSHYLFWLGIHVAIS